MMTSENHHIVATFIGKQIATFDPAQVDPAPPCRAVVIVEHHDDHGPVTIDQAEKGNDS